MAIKPPEKLKDMKEFRITFHLEYEDMAVIIAENLNKHGFKPTKANCLTAIKKKLWLSGNEHTIQQDAFSDEQLDEAYKIVDKYGLADH